MSSILEVIDRLYAAAGDVLRWREQFASLKGQPLDRFADRHLLNTHLQRAADSHNRLLMTERSAGAGQDAIDRVAHGVLVVTSDLQIILRNDVAREILREKDGLSEVQNALTASTSSETKALREAAGRGQGTPVAVVLTRRTPRKPLLTTIAPSPGAADDLCRNAVMFILDPDRTSHISGTLLSRLYGFTRAEAQFAILLMRGCSVEEAAGQLQISPHTARTHLKRLLLKTDTNRQGQLIALLLTGPAALLQTAPES